MYIYIAMTLRALGCETYTKLTITASKTTIQRITKPKIEPNVACLTLLLIVKTATKYDIQIVIKLQNASHTTSLVLLYILVAGIICQPQKDEFGQLLSSKQLHVLQHSMRGRATCVYTHVFTHQWPHNHLRMCDQLATDQSVLCKIIWLS